MRHNREPHAPVRPYSDRDRPARKNDGRGGERLVRKEKRPLDSEARKMHSVRPLQSGHRVVPAREKGHRRRKINHHLPGRQMQPRRPHLRLQIRLRLPRPHIQDSSPLHRHKRRVQRPPQNAHDNRRAGEGRANEGNPLLCGLGAEERILQAEGHRAQEQGVEGDHGERGAEPGRHNQREQGALQALRNLHRRRPGNPLRGGACKGNRPEDGRGQADFAGGVPAGRPA